MNIENQYLELLKDILENGVKKGDRTGTGTLSVFGRQIRHKMSEGFPLITTKKMYFKGIVTELLWFLRGDTNIKYLVDNNCHIWDGDAYKKYEQSYYYSSNDISYKDSNPKNGPWDKENFIRLIKEDTWFSSIHGDLGHIYGKQWRKWEFGEDKTFKNGKTYPSGEFMYDIRKESIDQIANLINDLKTNPDSRRLMVNAWNVGELKQMTLPPCHYGFQVYTRELSLQERSIIANSNHFEVSENIKSIGVDEDINIHQQLDELNIPKRAISLMWNQRSVDTLLGLPFNIASYALLLEILAREVNMVPDELIGNLGDTHLYLNHIEQAKEQITRETYKLPSLDIHPSILDHEMSNYPIDLFTIKDYQSHPSIKAPLSN